MLVLLAGLGLWMLGAVIGVPYRIRGLWLGLLWLVVVLGHVLLPDGHLMRGMTGGSVAPWLILGGVATLAFAYAQVLRWLRARAQPIEGQEQAGQGSFSETELDRYARHIMLREVGGPGQKRLKQARVLVVGAGGLGAPALQYLGAAGVGTIGVIDDDLVDNSNLQRQVIHRDADIGLPKVQSAQAAIVAQNPFVTVLPYARRLTAEVASELIADYDLVLDGTDNFETRYLINAACVAAEIPLVSGALSQWEGQLSVFAPHFGSPCYRCIFPTAPAAGLAPTCAEAGVIGPLPGVVGSMMASEAIKLVTGAGQALLGEMLIYDALYGETRKITLKRDPGCPICGSKETKHDTPIAG